MISTATLRYIRISPRKVRPVIDLVKGKRADYALAALHGIKKKASPILIDLISSAIANAKRSSGVEASELYVSNLIANGGPQMKRFRAASMGRAGMIRKRTSHITVELDTAAAKSEPAKAQATEASVRAAKPRSPAKSLNKEEQAVRKPKAKEKPHATKKGKE